MLLRTLFIACLALLLCGCAARATYHSRTGQDYPRVAVQAIRCDDGAIAALTAAGGVPIGTVDAKSLRVNATDDDLDEKAAKEAAKHGGTHIVLTTRGFETMTYATPGQATTECVDRRDDSDCVSTVTQGTETTVVKPTARFVVFRVPSENWTRLPEVLRPVGRNM
jgi:hypothetical protein